MEFRYRFLPEKGLVALRLAGPVSLGPLLDVIRQVWEHPSYHPDFDMLCDLSDAKASASPHDVPNLHRFLQADPRASRGRRAIVIHDPIVTALTMLYMRALPQHQPSRIFSTLSAAHEYLDVAEPIVID